MLLSGSLSPHILNRGLILGQSLGIRHQIIDRGKVGQPFVFDNQVGIGLSCAALIVNGLSLIADQEINEQLCIFRVLAVFDDGVAKSDAGNALAGINDMYAFCSL